MIQEFLLSIKTVFYLVAIVTKRTLVDKDDTV